MYFSWYSRNHPTGSIFVWFETSNWWIFVRNRGGGCQTKGRQSLIREFKERETNCWTVAFNKPEEFWFIIYCVNNLVKWCQCSRKILVLKFWRRRYWLDPYLKWKFVQKPTKENATLSIFVWCETSRVITNDIWMPATILFIFHMLLDPNLLCEGWFSIKANILFLQLS